MGRMMVAAAAVVVMCTVVGGCRGGKAKAVEAGAPATLAEAMALLEADRPAWDDRPGLNLVRHPYEKLISGWIFVLDPGHGGDAKIPGFKKGPTGVREAEMNYRVAVLLKKMLEDAGAKVVLTRDGDYDLTLSERAWYANNIPRADGTLGADFFISIHHNAADAPTANYTSMWYHGPVDRASVELDMARCVQLHVTDAMRTVVPPRQTLFSDRQMFPRGFGVLGAARVPAFLVEASFFSNPAEEQRLTDAVYNLRTAVGIYRGICDYARGGRPTQTLATSDLPGGKVGLQATLDDGLTGGWGAELGRILESSIEVRADGAAVEHGFDWKSRVLTAELPGGAEFVEVRFANHWKNSNYPQRYRVVRGMTDGRSVTTLWPAGVSRDPAPASTRPSTGPSRRQPGDDATTRPTPRGLPW